MMQSETQQLHVLVEQLKQAPAFKTLLAELQTGLSMYWESADQILTACGVSMTPPGAATNSFPKNFFSMLFLYSYMRAGISPQRRMLYAAILQCQRGMVTGCDNLLDDEYKPTLESDIPASGHRFRSVVDIMVSDRVLFQVLLDAATRDLIARDRVLPASTASMKTMTRSGIEEASEEAGITSILEPEAILHNIHHLKTGLLFQCPWDIPLTIETVDEEEVRPLLDGLYKIGMGCQIMDDMVDMRVDIQNRKHNYMVSLIHHGTSKIEKELLSRALLSNLPNHQENMLVSQFPLALEHALKRSHQFLTDGLGALFGAEEQAFIQPAIHFLEARIGVASLVSRE
jgi:hypothetical protein